MRRACSGVFGMRGRHRLVGNVLATVYPTKRKLASGHGKIVAEAGGALGAALLASSAGYDDDETAWRMLCALLPYDGGGVRLRPAAAPRGGGGPKCTFWSWWGREWARRLPWPPARLRCRRTPSWRRSWRGRRSRSLRAPDQGSFQRRGRDGPPLGRPRRAAGALAGIIPAAGLRARVTAAGGCSRPCSSWRTSQRPTWPTPGVGSPRRRSGSRSRQRAGLGPAPADQACALWTEPTGGRRRPAGCQRSPRSGGNAGAVDAALAVLKVGHVLSRSRLPDSRPAATQPLPVLPGELWHLIAQTLYFATLFGQ